MIPCMLSISSPDPSVRQPALRKRTQIHYEQIGKAKIALGARSKAWVFGRSLAEIAGSNPAGNMDVDLFGRVVYFQAEVSAWGWSPVRRNHTENDVSKWGRKAWTMRGPWPTRKRPEIWRTNSSFLLHDNAPAHRPVVVDFLAKNNVTTLQHPLYSPNMAPTDCYLFLHWNEYWREGAFVMLLT